MVPADAGGMNTEPFETAVCAASDLAARLRAELAQARCQLDDAEERFLEASADSATLHLPIPFQVRRDRVRCRREVALLRHVMAGMPNIEGDHHAASA